jgi:hypothetical protein
MWVTPGSTASCAPGISPAISTACSSVMKSWSPKISSVGAPIRPSSVAVQLMLPAACPVRARKASK